MGVPRINHRLCGASAIAVAACLALVACGSTGNAGEDASANKSTVGLPPAPGGVVARVGALSINQATFERWFAADVSTEQPIARVIPVPPNFTACIAHLQKAAAQRPGQAKAPSKGQLEQRCRTQYEETKERVVQHLIIDEWIVGAAEELGVRLSNSVVALGLAKYRREHFSTEAEYRQYLASSHQTTGDLLFATRVELLTEAIRGRLNERIGAFTPARIAAYYHSHMSTYAVSEKRDLRIVRTETRGEALEAKREIASGKSFASVVAKHPQHQPILSNKGLVLGLEPHVYAEHPLDRAIFTARAGVLSGPVRITLGYYVFEVTKIHPQRRKPLAEVSSSIKREVPPKLQQQALASFIARWRQQWTGRTDCAPGFVVKRCQQYRAIPGKEERADDAYAFD